MSIEFIIKRFLQIKKQLEIAKFQFEKNVLKKKITIPNLPGPGIIIVHHGAGNWGFNQVNNHHNTLWGFRSSLGYYIGYQWWIEYGGRVIQARADNEEGAHTIGWNKKSIGICLQGNTDIEPPTPLQLIALKELIDRLKLKYGIENRNVWAHKRVANKACPGRLAYKWLLENYHD